ncbi:hypothetical protein [Oceanobacillus saliphilus]|uniref:hypothetical protein n=1 Tax=Oceanobacillus saliphilus TaxID=2925834 RepID=UPI00201E40E6|nr:hypothetical protein [Oceanobacillus saliphilus]
MTAINNTPLLINDNPSTENNAEETIANEVNLEKYTENNIELPNKQEDNLPNTFMRYLSKETTDNQTLATQKEQLNDEQDRDNDQQNQSRKKIEFASLFSLFRRS